jgi:hypothetical protein
MDQQCYITEKVEGSNAALVRTSAGELIVCQRNYAIHLDEDTASNSFVTAFKIDSFLCLIDSVARVYPNKTVALRGELLGPGVQGNIYGLSKHEIRLFDIKVDGRYLGATEFLSFVRDPNMRVPTLAQNVTLRDWLSGQTVQEASDGYSMLAPKVRREGLVIKPMYEDSVDFGNGRNSRLVIKQRSPLYLANEK